MKVEEFFAYPRRSHLTMEDQLIDCRSSSIKIVCLCEEVGQTVSDSQTRMKNDFNSQDRFLYSVAQSVHKRAYIFQFDLETKRL